MTRLLSPHRINILYITVVICLQNWPIWVKANIPVCTTPECQRLALSYSKNMNKQINPCHNFYEYVCHGWGKQYPRPQYQDVWKVDVLMQERTLSKLKKLLEDPAVHPIEKFESAKALYKACIKLPYTPKAPANVIQKIMQTVGHWPMFFPKKVELPAGLNWWKIDNEYLKATGESALYNIHLIANEHKKYQTTTLIKQLSSPYGVLHRHEKWQGVTSDRDHYVSFLKKVIYNVAPSDPTNFRKVIDKDLEDVLKFRDSIRKITTKLTPKALIEIKIKDAQKRFGMDRRVKENAKINWLEVIRHFYGNLKDAYGREIQNDMDILMQATYVQKLLELLVKTPKRVIVNHIHIYFAERHLQLSQSMLEDLQESYNLANGVSDGYIREELPRERSCIKYHSMQKTIRSLYVSHVLPEENKKELMQLMGHAKKLLSAEISESPWMSANAKTKALRKLDSTSIIIDYPEWYALPSVDAIQQESHVDPLDPAIYYLPNSKRLYVGAAYLQQPNYSPHVPYVIKYGSTVALFGRSLQHLFDKEGLSEKYMGGPGWSPLVRRKHVEKTFCFEQQYGVQRQQAITKHHLRVKVQLPNTAEEDVADVVGLKIAYKGYKMLSQHHKNVCPVIPGFEDISCEKLFFIAFANTLCADMTKEGEKHLLFTDNHSLPQIRVNNAVGNMKEFSEAFGCKLHDPLNFKTRCDMWSDKTMDAK